MAGETTTSVLTNSVTTKYESDYLLAAAENAVWGQFVNWEGVSEGSGGSSFTTVAFQPMESEDTSALLPEADDIAATALKDDALTVTPYEYGRRVTLTSKLRFMSHVKTREAAARLVGMNMAETVERAIRRGILAGTSNVYMPSANVLRTGLDATSDKVTYTFLTELAAMAAAMGVEPFSGGDFVAPIHPTLEPDILALTEVKGIGYNFPEPLYKGEFARLAGIRFVRSRFGKLYLAGGTALQAATTVATSNVAAGDVTVNVADATGIVAGNYILLGTKEAADAEMVLVTAVSTNALTVRGIGNKPTNFGCKYAHLIGAAVTEAPNVAAIPIIGKNSISGVYAAEWGMYGKPVIKDNMDSLDRFLSLGWKWYGGVGIYEKMLIRGEVACSVGYLGSN